VSKYRRAAKVDGSQDSIVQALRKIPHISVEVGHDDIFVGYKGRNFWFELKSQSTVSKKTGKVRHSAIKESQHNLIKHWTGHYEIVWKIDQILAAIGL